MLGTRVYDSASMTTTAPQMPPATHAPKIHPTAIVDPAAELSPGVEVGPLCVVKGRVSLGPGVKLISGVTVEGPVEIGARTILYPGVCIGFPPQDYKFTIGSPTAGVRIGADCLIREHVTIHAASKPPDQGHPTSVGDRCFLMVGCHLGHDTRIGNDVLLVNGVLLAGHVEIMDKVTISGHAGVHQFCRVGRFAFISGLTAIARDVPPFVVCSGRNIMHGLNAVGLRRNGFPREHITRLREAFREAFRIRRTRPEQVAVLRSLGADCPPVQEMADFISASKRGIMDASTILDDGDE